MERSFRKCAARILVAVYLLWPSMDSRRPSRRSRFFYKVPTRTRTRTCKIMPTLDVLTTILYVLIYATAEISVLAPSFSFSSLMVSDVSTEVLGSDDILFLSSITDFLASRPPSYPNHVFLPQCGPLSNRKTNCIPYHPIERPAPARHPCSTNTLVPTEVPMIVPIKNCHIMDFVQQKHAF